MTRRSVMFVLLAVLVLSAAAWAVDETLIYTGDCVSMGNTTKLCAKAFADTGGGLASAPDIGVWFQAWTLAGIPRFPGPSQTMFTNSVGNVCTVKTLNTGLYAVQAFGVTGDFENVWSVPRVIGSLIPRNGTVGAATTGLATTNDSLAMESREIALGALLLIPNGFFTYVNSSNGQRHWEVLKQPQTPALREQFLLLDPDNPNGLTRITSIHFFQSVFSIGTSGPYGNALTDFQGFCDVQTGETSFRAWMDVEVRIPQGLLTPRPLGDKGCVDGEGTFSIQVRRLNGQMFLDLTGDFDGCSCLFITPPPP